LFLHYLVLHAQDFLIFKEKRRFFREAMPFRGIAAAGLRFGSRAKISSP